MTNVTFAPFLYNASASTVTEASGATGSVEDKAQDIWMELARRLAADGLPASFVVDTFGSEKLVYDPTVMARKIDTLLKTKRRAKDKKAGKKVAPEQEFHSHFLNPILIAGAYGYLREYRAIFTSVHEKFAVPDNILAALLLVETRLGTNTGKYDALPILASMAAADAPVLFRNKLKLKGGPLTAEEEKWMRKRAKQKADWAYKELFALLEYASVNAHDPFKIKSSSYGAIGMCQFMPTNVEHYGVDGDGDGKVDVFTRADALHSMGNYLYKHGWKAGLTHEQQLKVIYRYNHSMVYSRTILEVAERIKAIQNAFSVFS
ncbi:MAG: lytic murein transglycosylase [Desulfovibrio sp.]